MSAVLLTFAVAAVALGIVGLVAASGREKMTPLEKIMLAIATVALFIIGMGIRAWD